MTLTIITVCRNDLEGLTKTYNSLIKQSLEQKKWNLVQWVVVDGASNDGTIDFLSKCSTLPNFLYLSEPDSGIFDAMNKGVGLSNGRSVLFLNSGDIFYDENVLGTILTYITLSDSMIMAGRVKMIWNQMTLVSDLSPWVCHQAVVISKQLLIKFPFDPNIKIFGDLHLWLRLKKYGLFDVNRIELIFCKFTLGGIGNNPQNLWRRLRERNALQKEFGQTSSYIYRLTYTLILYILWKLMGENIYYKTLIYLSDLKYKNKNV